MTAAKAVIIWMGVTFMVWPKEEMATDIVPVGPLNCSSGQNTCVPSPTRSMPVLERRPKSLKYFHMISGPILRPMSISATLQEFSTASVRVWSPWPVCLWQCTGLVPGTTTLEPPQ